jgi:hypothetical protein
MGTNLSFRLIFHILLLTRGRLEALNPLQGKSHDMLSLNIRGVGGPLKLASMHRLLSKTSPHVIFLQETLTTEERERDFMFSLRPDWMSCAVSSVGSSGGLLISWDPRYFVFSPVLTCGGIFLTGSSLVDKRRLSLLNVYGPCTDRKIFWKKLEDRGLLAHTDLILAGDLNFTLNSR